jgi:hypothetical protein
VKLFAKKIPYSCKNNMPPPEKYSLVPDFVWHQQQATLTLRQLDEWNALPKGTVFRHFKAALGELLEGKDFFRIDGHIEREWVDDLRLQGRLYPSSVHAILLTGSGYQQLIRLNRSDHAPCPGEKGLRPIPFFSET